MHRYIWLFIVICIGSLLGYWIGTPRQHHAPFSCYFVTSAPSIQQTLTPEPKPIYPWGQQGSISPITKNYFRCKGSSVNPPIPVMQNDKVVENLFDCSPHGLPMRHGKEFIYPILIELLNEIQMSTGKQVVITSGHRCPQHNRYVDSSPKNQSSKHQLGAQVTFYVSGLEQQPHTVLNIIFAFYKSHPKYGTSPAAYTFTRHTKPTDVTTPPWFNKEIFIKWYKASEGRNKDNNHHLPYFDIQVRFDMATNMPVVYSSADALFFQRK